MKSMISSFEELAIGTNNTQSRDNILEAVRCYECGAFRASIVSAYVAVCFDLISKLKSLAEAGDGRAKLEMANLETQNAGLKRGDPEAVKKILEFERGLLELFFTEFELLDSYQYEELQRLRNDRNKCAHPTFLETGTHYNPSPELARMHIRNALRYVLAQPAKHGRAALASLKALVLGSYFPTDLMNATEVLRGSEYGSARKPLVDGFLDELIFGWPTPENAYHHSHAAIMAIKASLALHRETAMARLKINTEKLLKQPEADCVVLGAFLALDNVDIGSNLDGPSISRVRAFLPTVNDVYSGELLSKALTISSLADVAREKIATLMPEQLSTHMANPPAELLDRAVNLYLGARNWTDANALAQKCILPFVRYLNLQHVENIFAAATTGTADLLGSHGFTSVVSSLFEYSPLGKEVVGAALDKAGLPQYKRNDEGTISPSPNMLF